MTTARAIVLSVLGSSICLAFLGCAAPDPDTDSNVLANVETSVTPQWSPPLTGGVCPDPSVGSTERTEWYQAKATQVIQYLVGGNDPFTYEEVAYNPSCKDAQTNLTDLRNMITPYSMKIAPTATLQAATSGTVCTLNASLYAIDISLQLPVSTWDAQRKVGDQLDGCWGIGVSGFYYADPKWEENKTRRIFIDPEPAKLTSDLIGSTGATAAAVYTNTGTGTKVLKWPGTYTSSAYPPAAGTPCSTTDLYAGVETMKILQGSGSYRRCY